MRCYSLRKKYCSSGYYFGGVLEQIQECMGWNPLTKWKENESFHKDKNM
jgi:hypothetical protein